MIWGIVIARRFCRTTRLSRPGILWGSYHSRFSTCATSGWMPAYHGTWFYGLWSILHHGIILESSNEGKGLGGWDTPFNTTHTHTHTLTHPSIRGQISPIGRPWVLGTWGLRHTTFRHGTAIRSATSALWRWQFLPLRSQGRVLQWNKIRTLHTQNFQLPCIAHDFIRDILLLLLRLCISLQYRSCCGYRSFATNIPKKSWSMWKQYDEILKACCLNCADSAGSVQPRSCAKTTNSRRWSSVMVPIILNNCV